MYLLHDMPPVLLLSFICSALYQSFNLCLDLLSELCDELHVHIGFQEGSTALLQQGIENLEWLVRAGMTRKQESKDLVVDDRCAI